MALPCGPSLWNEAIAQATALIEGKIHLKKPPKDLSLILAKMALAGPGTTGLRALVRITGGMGMSAGSLWEPLDDITLSAMRISRLFIRLFNLKTSNALLRGLYKSDSQGASAYWRQVLNYCFDGGLQAVLDEYVHFLKESEGLFALLAFRPGNHVNWPGGAGLSCLLPCSCSLESAVQSRRP